jgi:hypothetical protein
MSNLCKMFVVDNMEDVLLQRTFSRSASSSMSKMSAVRHHRDCGVTCHLKCPIVGAKRLTSSSTSTTKQTKANRQAAVVDVADAEDSDDDEKSADDDTVHDATRVNNCTCTVLCVRAHAHLLCTRAALKAFAAACWSAEVGTYESGGPSTEHTSCVKARAMLHGDEYIAKLLSLKVRLLLLTTKPSTIATINNTTTTAQVYTMKTLESSLYEKVGLLLVL